MLTADQLRDLCAQLRTAYVMRRQAEAYNGTLNASNPAPVSGDTLQTARLLIREVQDWVAAIAPSVSTTQTVGWCVPGQSLYRNKRPSMFQWGTSSSGPTGSGATAYDVVDLAVYAELPLGDFTRKYPALFPGLTNGQGVSSDGREVILDTDLQATTGFTDQYDNGQEWQIGDLARNRWTGLMYVRESGQWRLAPSPRGDQPLVLEDAGRLAAGDYPGVHLFDELAAVLDVLTRTGRNPLRTPEVHWGGRAFGEPTAQDAKDETEADWADNNFGVTAFFGFYNQLIQSTPTRFTGRAAGRVFTLAIRPPTPTGASVPPYPHTQRVAAYATAHGDSFEDFGHGLTEDEWSEVADFGPGDSEAWPSSSFPLPWAAVDSIIGYSVGTNIIGVIDWVFDDEFTGGGGGSTGDDPPAAPTGLRATDISETTVDLAWDQSAEDPPEAAIDHFGVFRSTTLDGTYTKINGADVTTWTYHDTGLTEGAEYFYKVQAIDTDGDKSNFSNVLSIRTQTDPDIPTGGEAAPAPGDDGDTEIDLTWDANPEPGVTYNVYGSDTHDGTFTQLNGSPIATTSYTETGLTAGMPRWYKLTAEVGGVESGLTLPFGTTTTNVVAPAAPTGMAAVEDGTDTIDVSWDASADVDWSHTDLYRSTTSGSGFAKINSLPITDTSYEDTGLSAGTTYYYKAKHVDRAENESAFSAEASDTTEAGVIGAPTFLAWISQTFDGGTLNWTASPGPALDFYRLYKATSPGGPYTLYEDNIASTGTNVSSLPSGDHFFVVRAVNTSNAESANSNEVSINAM